MDITVIIKIAGLMFIVTGVIIFFLHRTLVSSTEGAVKRLNEEIAKTNKKQSDLTKKLKEADEELEKRRNEARTLADKMRSDVEEETKKQRDEIIGKARTEGEEIITKAQNAAEKFQKEAEKEIDAKGVDFALKILNSVLSEKAKGAFNEVLISDFLEKLKDFDLSRIGSDVNDLEVITMDQISADLKSRVETITKEKLGRSMQLNNTVDTSIGGGVVIKFGSMAIDGSLKNLLREEGLREKGEILEAQV